MGVTECDNMLMLLGVSNKMSEKVSVTSADAFTLGLSANICNNCVNYLKNIYIYFAALTFFFLFTGERQSHATDHSGIQGCVRRGRHVSNRRTNGAQPLGGDGRSRNNSLPAQRIYHVGVFSYSSCLSYSQLLQDNVHMYCDATNHTLLDIS